MSSAHRYRATWRDLLFNGIYDNTGITDNQANTVAAYAEDDFRLDSFDPSRVESQDYRELRQWLEGAEANEAYEGVMVALATGVIIAPSEARLEDMTALLRSQFSIANCRLAAETTDPPGVLPFDFRRATVASPGHLALRMYARPASARPVVIGRKGEGLSRRFRFSLVSFDPKFYSQAETTTAGSTTSTTAIVNAGDIYTQPEIDLVVGVGTATVAIALNGVAVLALAALPVGTWTIDAARSTIRKADGTNGMQYRSSGFISNIRLMAGANTLNLAGSSGLASVTIRHRDAYA